MANGDFDVGAATGNTQDMAIVFTENNCFKGVGHQSSASHPGFGFSDNYSIAGGSFLANKVGFLKVANFQKSVAADTSSIETLVGKAELDEDLLATATPASHTLSGLNTIASAAIRARATLTVLHSREGETYTLTIGGNDYPFTGGIDDAATATAMRAAMPHGAEGTGTSVTILGNAEGSEFSYNAKNAATSRIFAELTDESEFTTTNGVSASNASVDLTANDSVEGTNYELEMMGENITFVGGADDNATALALKSALDALNASTDASIRMPYNGAAPATYAIRLTHNDGNVADVSFVIVDEAPDAVQAQTIVDNVNALQNPRYSATLETENEGLNAFVRITSSTENFLVQGLGNPANPLAEMGSTTSGLPNVIEYAAGFGLTIEHSGNTVTVSMNDEFSYNVQQADTKTLLGYTSNQETTLTATAAVRATQAFGLEQFSTAESYSLKIDGNNVAFAHQAATAGSAALTMDGAGQGINYSITMSAKGVTKPIEFQGGNSNSATAQNLKNAVDAAAAGTKASMSFNFRGGPDGTYTFNILDMDDNVTETVTMTVADDGATITFDKDDVTINMNDLLITVERNEQFKVEDNQEISNLVNPSTEGEAGIEVSATITNATVTLTGPTDAAFTYSPSPATRAIIVNYIDQDGNFEETTTVSNNAAITVPEALKNAADALPGFNAALAGNTVTVTGKADGSNFTYQAVDTRTSSIIGTLTSEASKTTTNGLAKSSDRVIYRITASQSDKNSTYDKVRPFGDDVAADVAAHFNANANDAGISSAVATGGDVSLTQSTGINFKIERGVARPDDLEFDRCPRQRPDHRACFLERNLVQQQQDRRVLLSARHALERHRVRFR